MANFAPAASAETRGTAGDDKGPVLRPRETIGDLLRRTRMEFGVEIETVAASLRIRAPYIAAIEQARYDRLPGLVYALGFVRTYAIHLGLDGTEAVRRFKQEAAGLEKRRDLAFPMPLTPRSVPGGRMILAAFVLAVCAYGMWHYLSTGERARPERVEAVPTDLVPPPPPPIAAAPAATPAPSPDETAAAAPAAASAPTSPAPAGAAPAPDVAAAAPAATATPVAAPPAPDLTPAPVTVATLPPPPAPAPVAETAPPAETPAVAALAPAAAPAAAAATAHVFGAVDGPSRITLHAVKDCWIQVRASDDAHTVIAQRTLRAGDSYRVPARAGLTLRTGNASGLAVTVDDKPVPVLGGTVREVPLDPDRLIAGNARVE